MSTQTKANTGVYPGSFDPITLGHLDILFQAARLMTKLYVVVGVNPKKSPLFTCEERVAMIRNDIKTVVAPRLEKENIECDIEVTTHTGLIAAFMEANNAPFYIRGLRVGTEFDQEYPTLKASELEYKSFTPVFLCTLDHGLNTVSSTLAREVAVFGGKTLEAYVTPASAQRLQERVLEKGMRLG